MFSVDFLPPSYAKTSSDLVSLLNKNRIRYMLVGAFPVNVYGRERTTKDVDVVLAIDKFKVAELLSEKRYSLIYPDDVNSIINMAKFRDRRTGMIVDVLLNPREFTFTEETFRRARKVKVGSFTGFIPSAEDYIISKLKSARSGSSDFQDVVSVLLKNSDELDWKYLERRAKEENKLYLLSYYKNMVKRRLS